MSASKKLKKQNGIRKSQRNLNLDDNASASTAPPSLKNGNSKSSKSPNIRRHFSEPTINLEKLFALDAAAAENDANTDNKLSELQFDESNFSKDPMKFAQELRSMIERIKIQKESPQTYTIMISLLEVLDFWIKTHGISAINELAGAMNKYDALQLDHNKERMILEQTIEEYRSEYNEYQQRRDAMNAEHKELNLKIKDLSEQLQNAAFFQQRLVHLREELDAKTIENAKNVKLCNTQRQKISKLKKESEEFLQVIEVQTEKISQMTVIESELKINMNEIKRMNAKYKEIEAKLKRVNDEKDQLFKEKKMGENKLKNYGKLQNNLKEYKANEKEYERKIKELNAKHIALQNEMKKLKKMYGDDLIGEGMVTLGGRETKFISFRDEVHSYNTDEGMRENDDGVDGNDDDNDGTKDGYAAVYKSIAFIGVCCLCYVVYSRYSKAIGAYAKYRKLRKKIEKKRFK